MRRVLAIAAAGLAACSVLACATPREAEPGVLALAELRFEGNASIDDADLRGKLVSTETARRPLGVKLSRLPFGAVRPYDDDVLKTDLGRVERLYRARGWLSARVTDFRVDETDTGAAVVTIVIVEGRRARVAAIEMPGIDAVIPEARSRIVDELPLEVGDPFTEDDYDALKSQLQAQLREWGYAEATVAGKAMIDPERAEARITLDVVPGLRYRMGRIVVSGATAIARRRIVDVSSLEEGEWYSTSRLNTAQQRVFDMGVFGGVRVTRGAVMRDRGIVPVLITVRETPFQTVKLGGGVGLEQRRQEGRGRVEYTHRNLLGGQRRLTAELRAGYAFLPNVFAPKRSGVVGLAALEFAQPRVLLQPLDIVARVEVERSLGVDYTDNALRSRLSTPIYFGGRQLVLTPGANFEYHDIEGARRADSLLYAELRATSDFRNNPLEPVRGFFADLTLQRGFAQVGGFGFWKVVPDLRAYRRGPWGTVFAGRLRVGMLMPDADKTSIVTRFFGGGANGFRGFGSQRMSPLRVEEGKVVRFGGEGLVEASVEIRFRLSGDFGLVTFLDAGEVTRSAGALGLDALEYAPGAGLRWHTPLGAVRLDVAWRLGPLQPALVDGVAYERDGRLQFHLSIGEAF